MNKEIKLLNRDAIKYIAVAAITMFIKHEVISFVGFNMLFALIRILFF